MGKRPYSFAKMTRYAKRTNLERVVWLKSGFLVRSTVSTWRGFAPPPAFRHCAIEKVDYLLESDGRPDGHGIRPRCLKATTISALTTEVEQRQENLSLLSIRGDFRDVAPQDMDRVYS